MTAITIAAGSDIPTNVNTLEKLGAWVGLAMARCNPNNKILEFPNTTPQRVAETSLIKADDGSYRLVIRLSIPVADNYPENTAKFWQNALVINDTALPAAFKVA